MVHPNFAVKHRPNYALGAGALMIGSAINYFGDRLLDAHLELFQGLAITFGMASLLDIFLVPFIAGLAVAWIYGQGGKWLSYIPPFLVRIVAYLHLASSDILPDGSSLMPMGWWGFFVVLVVESSAFGGILGEIFLKRVYTRSKAARDKDMIQPGQSNDAAS
jgi:hypothetical protein